MLFSLSSHATCRVAQKEACLEEARIELDRKLADLGFDPNMAAVGEPRILCSTVLDPMNVFYRYTYPYVSFGGIVDFKAEVEMIMDTNECYHSATRLIWPE